MIKERHFEAIQRRFPAAAMRPNLDGSTTIVVPNMPLPAGWNRQATSVAFIVPAGYPLAAPDCFWSEPALALAHGGIPKNTSQQGGAGVPPGWLWFSWHPNRWDPNCDTLETYLRVIGRRFHEKE